MGRLVVSAFPGLSATRFTSTTTRQICAAAPARDRSIRSPQALHAFRRGPATLLSSDGTAVLPPAPPCRGNFSYVSGVCPPLLSSQISCRRSYAAVAVASATSQPLQDLQSPPQPLLAKDSLLAALEAVKRSADSGSVYLLESSVQEALPEHAEAKAKVAAIRELVRDLEQLKQERARLAMFRHQTPKEIRSEYAQMMLTGLFTGLAAAIHPIFFVGTIGGLIRMRRTRRAEVDRDAGTVKMDEVNRTVKEKRAALNAHIDALAHMVGQ